jgi:glycosyltransferase involved in cell wall biosynthesis
VSATERPLVSVLIPAFNAQATLCEAVRSVLVGTYENIEVVVIDDGSTDCTAKIAADLSADPRIRIVAQGNAGPAKALNAGLAVVRGEFVARLDADDVWHPTKLEKQLELALTGDAPDFIYTFYRYIDVEGRVLFDGPPQRFPKRAFRRSLYETLVGTGSSMLMRRRTLVELGGWDETHRNSEDFLLQLSAAAHRSFGFVPEYLVGYRLHPTSLSQDSEAMRDVWFDLQRRLRETFDDVPAKVYDWANARGYMSMAEGFARKGQVRQALRLFLSAVRADPAWSSAFLAHRAGKWVRGAKLQPGRRPFLEYDPTKARDARSALYGTEGMLMGRLHRRRSLWLQKLDAAGD